MVAVFSHRGGRVAATANPRDRRHPRIVPAVDMPIPDELHELPLAHHGVVEIQSGELCLFGRSLETNGIDDPIGMGWIWCLLESDRWWWGGGGQQHTKINRC